MKKTKAVKRDALKHCAKNPGQERAKLRAHGEKLARLLKRVQKSRDALFDDLFALSDAAFFAGEYADEREHAGGGACEVVVELTEIEHDAITAFEAHLDQVWDYTTDAIKLLKEAK